MRRRGADLHARGADPAGQARARRPRAGRPGGSQEAAGARPARTGARAGRPDRERPRGAARARGASRGVRAVRPAAAEPRGAGRPARAADVHDRPRDREGLRRRDLHAARGRRRSASWVHIADVSWFVPRGSPLDRGAAERALSVYVPGFVAPMLPHELADDACSLRPNVDRLCVTVEVLFDGSLEAGEPTFYRSVIRSNERLTYGQAESILAGPRARGRRRHRGARLAETIALELRRRRFARGALRIASAEIAFAFDGRGRRRAGAGSSRSRTRTR